MGAARQQAGRGAAWAVIAVLALGSPSSPAWAAPAADRETALRQLATEAKAAHRRGDYRRAAELYWQGWLLDPSDGGYLYGSARALQLAGEVDLAVARYRAFLDLKRQPPALVAKARLYLAELQVPRPAVPSAQPAPPQAEPPRVEPPPPVAVPPPEPPTPTVVLPAAATPVALAAPPLVTAVRPSSAGWAPWATLALGAGVALAGGVVAGLAERDRQRFEAKMAPGFAGAAVAEYGSRQAALQDAQSIGARRTGGWAAVAVGAVVAVAGALWCYATASAGEPP